MLLVTDELKVKTASRFVCPGIETMSVYWPVKLRESSRVIFFHLQLWDCGENALRRFDHLLPVRVTSIALDRSDESGHSSSVFAELEEVLSVSLSFQACKEQLDAVLILFSFTDRTSFDDLTNQIAKWTGPLADQVVMLVVGTKYPFINVCVCVDMTPHSSVCLPAHVTLVCSLFPVFDLNDVVEVRPVHAL